jgi:hypothetical protein
MDTYSWSSHSTYNKLTFTSNNVLSLDAGDKGLESSELFGWRPQLASPQPSPPHNSKLSVGRRIVHHRLWQVLQRHGWWWRAAKQPHHLLYTTFSLDAVQVITTTLVASSQNKDILIWTWETWVPMGPHRPGPWRSLSSGPDMSEGFFIF